MALAEEGKMMGVEIDGVEYSRTQSCCDDCWWKRRQQEPYRMKDAEEETCCYCGEKNTSGIYVRVDPRLVAHPTMKDDDGY